MNRTPKSTAHTIALATIVAVVAVVSAKTFADTEPLYLDLRPLKNSSPSARIFNGITSFQFPETVAYLISPGVSPRLQLQCSGTLIGPKTVLIAGHCACPQGVGVDCQPGALFEPDPAEVTIFLQHWGLVGVDSISIPPEFCFDASGTCEPIDFDYAVINLAEEVDGIRPAALATNAPSLGTNLTIVGFGNDGEAGDSFGIKRSGQITTVSCNRSMAPLGEGSFLCWELVNGAGQNTCLGDSGGPAFLTATNPDAARIIAGTTSGGTGFCDDDDMSFDTLVPAFRDDIIRRSTGRIEPTPSGDQVFTTAATLADTFVSTGIRERIVTFNVATGTSRLVITSNGTDGSDSFAVNADVVSLRHGSAPTDLDFDCRSAQLGSFQTCSVSNPEPGVWFGRIERLRGTSGSFQVTVATFASAATRRLDPRIRLVLEEPEALLSKTGVSNLRGWAVGPNGIDRVELYIDGEFVDTIPYGGGRGDVANVFPELPNSGKSGFSQAINYNNLASETPTFRVKAIAPDGSFNEASNTFRVVRFPNRFIKDPAAVTLSGAQANIRGETVELPRVSVEGVRYNLTLEWRTATQNFGITEIVPSPP